MLGFGRRRRRLNLALQGGGAHGAFTWGVIDRLLDAPEIELGWLSGTSAGAVNAVALAAGLAEGGPEGGRAKARDKLRAVWEAVIEAGVPDLLRLNPFLAGISRSQAMGNLGSLFSPYEFNPLGFDPLRKLLSEHIDFAALRAATGIELLIAATDVATGRARLFRRSEISVEHVLASACLPTVHHAVEIEGRAYWDGGFAANPDLVTLARESPIGDTLLVLLDAPGGPGVPRTARAITAEVSRITFGQPLIRDVGEILAVRSALADRWRWPPGTAGALARHRFHMIEAGRHTSALAPETRMRPDRTLLNRLQLAGRDETGRWLETNLRAIGRRETADLPGFLRREPVVAPPQPEPSPTDEPEPPEL